MSVTPKDDDADRADWDAAGDEARRDAALEHAMAASAAATRRMARAGELTVLAGKLIETGEPELVRDGAAVLAIAQRLVAQAGDLLADAASRAQAA